MGLLARMIRPPDEIVPNPNDPASVPPATVGPPAAVPGDPHGVEIVDGGPSIPPPRVVRVRLVGLAGRLVPPTWNGQLDALTDTAWTCLDLNSSVLATMPPYLVGAADNLDAGWLRNPEPRHLHVVGGVRQAAVLGLPARRGVRHRDSPLRDRLAGALSCRARLGGRTSRWSTGCAATASAPSTSPATCCTSATAPASTTAHGHGPLEAGAPRLVADSVLNRYAASFAAAGGIPASILDPPRGADRQAGRRPAGPMGAGAPVEPSASPPSCRAASRTRRSRPTPRTWRSSTSRS